MLILFCDTANDTARERCRPSTARPGSARPGAFPQRIVRRDLRYGAELSGCARCSRRCHAGGALSGAATRARPIH